METKSFGSAAEDAEQWLLRQIRFGHYRLTMQLLEDLYLPDYKGSTLRGAFGHAFRKVMCVAGLDNCNVCDYRNNCFYKYVFETEIATENPAVRNPKSFYRPYIIRPPLEDRMRYRAGENLIYELILFGDTAEKLKYVVSGAIAMGAQGLGRRRGQAILTAIEDLGEGRPQVIYCAGDRDFRKPPLYVTAQSVVNGHRAPQACTFHFLTRLNEKNIGRSSSVRFLDLFRVVLRRIIGLAQLCGIQDAENVIDRAGLFLAAEQIKPIDGMSSLCRERAIRHSNRQEKTIPFGGSVGSLSYKGNLEPFWPYLLLGEITHIGKNTTFGLGRYELIEH